jgi:hypothetical protein
MAIEIQTIIYFIIGLVFIFLGNRNLGKRNRLMETGVEVEGIIFEFESNKELVSDANFSSKYPVVRFVTTEGQWITKSTDIGLSTSFFKEGEKIKVKYNPDNPDDFIITSSLFKWIPYTLIALGLIMVVAGLYSLVVFIKTP